MIDAKTCCSLTTVFRILFEIVIITAANYIFWQPETIDIPSNGLGPMSFLISDVSKESKADTPRKIYHGLQEFDELPFVSILTPHLESRAFLSENIYLNFMNINYPPELLELIVYYEGFENDPFLSEIDDDRIHLFWHDSKEGITKLGLVRNLMNEMGNGTVLINMDSDDYYHPLYVPYMVRNFLLNPGAKMVSLRTISHALLGMDGSFRFRYSEYDPNCADGWLVEREAADTCTYRSSRPANEETRFKKCVYKTWTNATHIIVKDTHGLHIKFQWENQVTRQIYGFEFGRYADLSEEENKYHRQKLIRTLKFLHYHGTSYERKLIPEEVDYQIFWAKKWREYECVQWVWSKKLSHKKKWWTVASDAEQNTGNCTCPSTDLTEEQKDS